MRRLLFGVGLLILIFVGLILLSRNIGWLHATSNPDRGNNRLLFATGNCSQPCWHNIQVGKTTFAEAQAILQNDDFIVDLRPESDNCQLHLLTRSVPLYEACIVNNSVNRSNDIVQGIVIRSIEYQMVSGAPIGEVLPDFGSPRALTVCKASGDALLITLYISRNIEIIIQSNQPDIDKFSLREQGRFPVLIVEYFAGDKSLYNVQPPPWRGFNTLRSNYYPIESCP